MLFRSDAALARSGAVAARNDAQSARDAAEGHANRAATSESNAKTSETNAKQSETNAGDYAAVSTTAATEAVDALEQANQSISLVAAAAQSFEGHSPQQVMNAVVRAESARDDAMSAQVATVGEVAKAKTEAQTAKTERERAEAAAWKAELTTVGVNVVESPVGSNLWTIGSDQLAIIETPNSSGLYEFGVI